MGERSLAARLYDDFISQNRYMYLVKGLGNTIIITVFALLIGVVIGVIVALIRVNYQQQKKRGPVLWILNFVSGLYLTVIRGTPMVVQLMIMYFVIWASGAPIMIDLGQWCADHDRDRFLRPEFRCICGGSNPERYPVGRQGTA